MVVFIHFVLPSQRSSVYFLLTTVQWFTAAAKNHPAAHLTAALNLHHCQPVTHSYAHSNTFEIHAFFQAPHHKSVTLIHYFTIQVIKDLSPTFHYQAPCLASVRAQDFQFTDALPKIHFLLILVEYLALTSLNVLDQLSPRIQCFTDQV